MSVPDSIQASHLQRLAVVYVRQSSHQQTINNQESLKLHCTLSHLPTLEFVVFCDFSAFLHNHWNAEGSSVGQESRLGSRDMLVFSGNCGFPRLEDVGKYSDRRMAGESGKSLAI